MERRGLPEGSAGRQSGSRGRRSPSRPRRRNSVRAEARTAGVPARRHPHRGPRGRRSCAGFTYYLRFVVAASLLLIVAGGLVTSTGSGLAVPDWPNTYGTFMFAFPFSKMVGGIFYEHGHRLIASLVGLLTIGLAVWIARSEPRRWVRGLGWTALAAVIAQGLLGGITVLYFLPTPISISHAGLAQLFFALVVGLALFTSPGWRGSRGGPDRRGDHGLARLALAAPVFIYGQILLGATMRHTGAGLAIPDFPLAFGRLVPRSGAPASRSTSPTGSGHWWWRQSSRRRQHA